MTVRVTLRPVTAADRGFLRAVYASTRAEELAPVPWPQEAKDAFLDQQFDAQSAHYRARFPDAAHDVIADDGRDVGRLYVDRREREIRIVDIALLPEGRGRGIGTHLLGRLAEEADAAGKTLVIHVERGNPARRLYERMGFAETGRQGPYCEMRRPVGGRGVER